MNERKVIKAKTLYKELYLNWDRVDLEDVIFQLREVEKEIKKGVAENEQIVKTIVCFDIIDEYLDVSMQGITEREESEEECKNRIEANAKKKDLKEIKQKEKDLRLLAELKKKYPKD